MRMVQRYSDQNTQGEAYYLADILWLPDKLIDEEGERCTETPLQ